MQQVLSSQDFRRALGVTKAFGLWATSSMMTLTPHRGTTFPPPRFRRVHRAFVPSADFRPVILQHLDPHAVLLSGHHHEVMARGYFDTVLRTDSPAAVRKEVPAIGPALQRLPYDLLLNIITHLDNRDISPLVLVRALPTCVVVAGN